MKKKNKKQGNEWKSKKEFMLVRPKKIHPLSQKISSLQLWPKGKREEKQVYS